MSVRAFIRSFSESSRFNVEGEDSKNHAVRVKSERSLIFVTGASPTNLADEEKNPTTSPLASGVDQFSRLLRRSAKMLRRRWSEATADGGENDFSLLVETVKDQCH